MLNNLKLQLIIIFALIFTLFFVQSYISNQSYKVLADNLLETQNLSLEVANVKSLEQQVTDLQRNVLLYRETGSESVTNRFNNIIEQIEQGISHLSTYAGKTKAPEKYLTLIDSMKIHLTAYKEYFTEIKQLSDKREYILLNTIHAKTALLKENVEKKITESHTTNQQQKDYIQLYSMLNALEYLSYQYFVSSNITLIDTYQDKLAEINQTLTLLDNQPGQEIASQLSISFFKLVQLSRNYNYLVNVVMSGSANEFFYLAETLSQLVMTDLKTGNDAVKLLTKDTIEYHNYLFIFGLFILSLLITLITIKLILPIEKLTKIFDSLAQNKPITNSLAVKSSDIIDKLYASAVTFNEKNVQTRKLLKESLSLNRRLSETTDLANKATRSKSIFLANMSHEIRTPMNGIVGMVDLLRRTSLEDEQREYVDKIKYSSQILMCVINDILDFSKIEAGKLSLENICFSPTETIENIIDAITIKANEKNLNVHCTFRSEVPDKIYGDPVRLTQILLNLANNAVKFTQLGEVGFSVESIKLNHEKCLKVDVYDTGIGIAKDKIDKVFEDFSQAEDSTTRAFGGTGLGLSIAKQLAHLMNGKISVTSKEGHGSCFTLVFPFTVQEQKTLSDSSVNTTNQALANESAQPLKSEQKHYQFKQLILCYLDDSKFFDPACLTLISKNTLIKHDINEVQPLINQYNDEHEDSIEDLAILFTAKEPLNEATQEGINQLFNKYANVRMITDTTPRKHINHLRSLWPNSVIHQPITPSKLLGLYSVTQKDTNTEKVEKESSALPQFHAHILLVEDNAINQAVAGKMLSSFGVTFEIAEDGQQAVNKIANNSNYDLVFMDIQMPVMDGYEATKAIRAKGITDLIICGLSANAMGSDINAGIKSGMNDYITKPLEIVAIEKVLMKYLHVFQIKNEKSLSS